MTPIRPESSAGLRMRSMIVLTRTRAMSRLMQRRAEWAVSQLQLLSTLHGGILQRDKAVWRVSLVGGSRVWAFKIGYRISESGWGGGGGVPGNC